MPRDTRSQPPHDGATDPHQLGPMAPSLANLAAHFRAKADELRAFHATAQAATLEWAAVMLEQALRTAADEVLTLEQAAKESGYATETLRHKLASGELHNAGAKNRPRIRRGDLPRRVAASDPSRYDADADALSIVRRQRAS